jgi:2-methylcitrate dehydratase PrpD
MVGAVTVTAKKNREDSMTEYSAAALGLGITEKLAAYLSALRFEDLPEDVVHHSRRGVLDWLGCALAGSGHGTIDTLLAVLTTTGAAGGHTVIGHDMRLGMLEAALANGQMGHVLDYDDTHMDGVVIHASGPITAALLALGEQRKLGGKAMIAGYVAGFEAALRTGHGAPRHYQDGWHQTGTLGAIGAAAACGTAMGIGPEKMVYAFGIAAAQSAGMLQNRGTMCKSFQAGKAASNGLLAALLAEGGFDSSIEILEGRQGFCRIYSSETDEAAMLQGLGDDFFVRSNGFKPYACGIVLHPIIDAAIGLRDKAGVAPEAVESIVVTANAKAISIAGIDVPESGLKAKFSTHHATAVAYLDGAAGTAQFSNARALADEVAAMRLKVSVEIDDTLRNDQARSRLTAASGETFEFAVEHATGTAANPMSDAALEAKFMANAVPTVGEVRAGKIRDLVWGLDALDDIGELTAGCS